MRCAAPTGERAAPIPTVICNNSGRLGLLPRSSVHLVPSRGDRPPVITAAELSYNDQFRIRRRRYVIMMGMRVPFLIAATALYHIPWLALVLIAISVPLPWMAVLVANDRPARRQRMAPAGTINHERALTGGSHEIIDSSAAADRDPAEHPS